MPGTTRDRLEETANIDGVPVVLVDAAGLRETKNVVERVGVERAESALRESDLILFVLDCEAGVTPDDRAAAGRLREIPATRILTVLNKRDIVSGERMAGVERDAAELLPGAAAVAVSALTGDGVRELERRLLALTPVGPLQGETGVESVVVSSVRHREALEAALASLREAEHTAEQRLPGDFIAIDARGALDALGLITGETVTDDIVHRIFRDFCVGK
jgi:tRNA modification GTPase